MNLVVRIKTDEDIFNFMEQSNKSEILEEDLEQFY
jgi:hypothetical protein